MKINIIEVDGEDINISTETKESKKEVITERSKILSKSASVYARIFNDGCKGWTKDAEFNLVFLKNVQSYCNDLLREKRHLYLNEVYDLLGIPKTKTGDIVGWIYDENHPDGDNYVDFGLYDECNFDFINGWRNTALLDFNVDGNILEKLI